VKDCFSLRGTSGTELILQWSSACGNGLQYCCTFDSLKKNSSITALYGKILIAARSETMPSHNPISLSLSPSVDEPAGSIPALW